MTELSRQEQAANALGETLLAVDQDLKGKFSGIYNELSAYTGSGGFCSLLESDSVSGPNHPFYLEAVVGDARILERMREVLPQFLGGEDMVLIYVGALISHMNTLEGQEEAIQLHRNAVAGNKDVSERLEFIFKGIEERVAAYKESWVQKFGTNPNVHDVIAAVQAAEAGPKIADLSPPGPDWA